MPRSHHDHEPDQAADRNTIVVEDDALREGFTQVPNALLRMPGVTHGAKLAYALLLSYAWREGSCFPGQEQLAHDLSVERKAVIRYLQELKDKHLIRVERRGMGKTNVYFLPRLADVPKMGHQEVPSAGRQEVPSMGHKEYPLTKTQREEYHSNIRMAEPVVDKWKGEDAPPPTSSPRRGGVAKLADLLAPEQQRLTERVNGRQPQGQAEQAAPRTPPPDQRVSQLPDERAADRPRAQRGRPPKVYDEDRQVIGAYIEDFARALNDTAPLKSSVSRADNLYRAARLSREAFIGKLYEAKSITRERSAGIRSTAGDPSRPLSPKRKMAYFFSVLEDVLGLKDEPSGNVLPPN